MIRENYVEHVIQTYIFIFLYFDVLWLVHSKK